MSKFLDELFDNLDTPENKTDDNVTTDGQDEVPADIEEPEVEQTTESDEGVAEEVAETEESKGAPDETDAEDDDDTELTPAERKAYGRLKALQDEREKRRSVEESKRTIEAERDRLNAELANMRRQAEQTAAQNMPNPYEDPDGYMQAREAQYQEAMTRQALGFSIEKAVGKYGESEVEKAANWFQTQMDQNPHIPLRDNMLSQADQMEYVVSSYKQAQQMNAFASGDYSGIVAELQKAGFSISKAETPAVAATTASATQHVAAPAATTANPAPSAPKRSKLASTSAATTAPSKDVSFLDTVTRGK